MSSSFARCGVASLLLVGVLGTGCGIGWSNNSPIVIEGPELSSKDVAAGTEVQVHLVVTDEDGDPLTYKWRQNPPEPAGLYSDASVKEPSWVAPEVTAPTIFTLQVNIQDGEGSSLVGFTSIFVHPR